MMPHQHKIKSTSPPSMKTPPLEKKHTKHYLLRSLPLLLLIFYVSTSVLKLDPPSSSSNSFLAEFDSLRTHVSSNKPHHQAHGETREELSCSALIDGAGTEAKNSRTTEAQLCCDRTQYRTDICYMGGDVRTKPTRPTILLCGTSGRRKAMETVRPYTRKWESGVMSTIEEVTLRPLAIGDEQQRCDVHHKGVVGVVFSAGGYTGNVYHEFNDGMIPLFITVERFKREVVLLVLEYHSWWFTKYRGVLQELSKYKVVDLAVDQRVHCFDEVIVGLKIHGELSIDPQLMPNGKGIHDFQALLARGFNSPSLPPPLFEAATIKDTTIPRIAIFVRHKSRTLINLRAIIKLCRRIGFEVLLLSPRRTTPLSEVHAALNSSNAMLAVHGAAMTHLLFLRPGSVLLQVVPLGLDRPAESFYGEPARKLGLQYMPYKVGPEESSLSRVYGRQDPIITDPDAITSKGWSETKKVYLDQQNVKLNLRRFGKLLEMAHVHIRR